MTVYTDSSFIVSLYLVDRYSQEAWRRILLSPRILLTPFHRAEFTHAVQQHVFRQLISAQEAQKTLKNFDIDSASGSWVKVVFPEAAFETCAALAQRHVATLGVRTLDSLHVACALELKVQKFWTFDERQLRLAEAVGLDTTA
ncbi:MAG: type II toxin-antitoxin system VapC family toxin [Terracidiphilus sp.]